MQTETTYTDKRLGENYLSWNGDLEVYVKHDGKIIEHLTFLKKPANEAEFAKKARQYVDEMYDDNESLTN